MVKKRQTEGETKIEKKIPLPRKYPFDEMEVGDSFELPTNWKRTTVAVAALRYGKVTGTKFSIRKTPEGFRCWRIK